MVKISNNIVTNTNKWQVKKKLPDVLIYRPKSKFPNSYDVNMFKTDGSKSYSTMHCLKENQWIDGEKKPCLLVSMLLSKPGKQGLGHKMLDYAVKVSKELGCEGRFYLCADPQFTPNEVPHIFYRKFGMNTKSEKINNKLDEFIKEGKPATIKDFQKEVMYYPPVPVEQETVRKPSVWDKIKDWLGV